MNQKELLEFLKKQPDDLEELDLNSKKLTRIPPSIGRFASLKTLSLANNQLTTLPAEISSLTALTWLDLDNNQLTTSCLRRFRV